MSTVNQETATLESDIVIAGGGPVGLAMACALSATGLQVVLVDASKEVFTVDELIAESAEPDFDPRVSALTVVSQQMLDDFGAWDAIASARVCPYQSMHVWDGDGTGSIHFSADDLHEQALGFIVENRLVTAALFARAVSHSGLALVTGKSIDSIEIDRSTTDVLPVLLTLSDGSTIASRLLVGADGANSLVREQSGFAMRRWDYGHKAIVTTVETEKPHEYTAWQRFMPTGPLAFLPLHVPGREPVEQRYCSIVWSCVTETAEGVMGLDDDAFNKALGKAFESRLGVPVSSARRLSFPLWQRHATDYVQSNVALVGDAAHTIHPLAGQGVNLGFADVLALAQVIQQAVANNEDFSSHQVLSRYQRKRKGHNLGMMAAMEGFKRLFGSEDLTIRWLRNAGLDLTDNLPMLKARLMRQAMGI